jgi:hypothetical protein
MTGCRYQPVFSAIDRGPPLPSLSGEVDLMKQSMVGFRVDSAFEEALERAVAMTGMDRAKFGREAIRVAVLRAIDGLDPFSGDPAPRVEHVDILETLTRLRMLALELDRVLLDNNKQAVELRNLARDDAGLMQRARKELLDGYPDRIRLSFRPIMTEIRDLAKLAQEPPSVQLLRQDYDGLRAEIADCLKRIETAAGEPRSTTVINLAGWTVSHLGRVIPVLLTGMFLLVVGVIVFLPLGLKLPLANRSLGGGTEAVCALATYSAGAEDCSVSKDGNRVLVVLKSRAETK